MQFNLIPMRREEVKQLVHPPVKTRRDSFSTNLNVFESRAHENAILDRGLFSSNVQRPITYICTFYTIAGILARTTSNGGNFHAKVFVTIALALSLYLPAASPCRAEFAPTEANFTKLVDSIYSAEGGAKTRHPYGILTKYKTTTPRQACFNSVRNTYKRWEAAGRPGDYLSFLAKRYCPIGAKNDPTGLNKNWLKNVTFFFDRKGGVR